MDMTAFFIIISPRTALKETLTAKNIGSFVLNTRRETKFRALLHSIALHLEACFRDQRSVCLIQRDVVDWFIESSSLFGYYLICGFSIYLVIYLFIYVFLPLLFYWKTVYLPLNQKPCIRKKYRFPTNFKKNPDWWVDVYRSWQSDRPKENKAPMDWIIEYSLFPVPWSQLALSDCPFLSGLECSSKNSGACLLLSTPVNVFRKSEDIRERLLLPAQCCLHDICGR